jgi:hypothetical protein
MSRTQDTKTTSNPANKFISLSGTSGKFYYWDKNLKEKVELEYPITFLPLDVLSKITGYHQAEKKGIYSNEVHNLANERLVVKLNGGGELASGFYQDIKTQIKEIGGKFTNSVYAMMKKDDDFEIVNFQFHGASLSPFIEYTQYVGNIYANAIQISKSEKTQNGSITFYVPTFKTIKTTPETSTRADELDIVLQKYFKKDDADELVEKVEELEPIDDDLPF